MRPILPVALVYMILGGPLAAQQAADAIAPESGTETSTYALSDRAQAAMAARDAGDPVVAQDWMVVAANPLAVEAGADVLAAGGTAADAMVAVQAVLGLVEPQSSGLGGGAFLVWFDAASGELTTLDGRETAPLAATPTLFQDAAGEPLGFWDAVVGGLSVGTPGTPALMEEAHRRWGMANWGGLLEPAIVLADNGFSVSARMAGSIANDAERLSTFPATAAYFLPEGAPLAEGTLLHNLAYANTLRAMQAHGADAIYSGEIAEGIIATVRHAEGNPGVLSMRDLDVYEVVERPAVCAAYRGLDVCGMGPPSSGALTVGQILGISGQFALDILGPDDPESWRIIGYVATTIIAHYDWGLDIQDAISLPHAVKRFGTYDLEEGTDAEGLSEALEALGYEVNIRSLNSGLHAIAITPDGLMGGADPRREGIALGQ